MAVVNQYKFFGLTAQDASSAGKKMFGTTIVPPVTGDTKQQVKFLNKKKTGKSRVTSQKKWHKMLKLSCHLLICSQKQSKLTKPWE